MKVDTQALRERKKEGLLKSQHHASLPLSIWNYTDRAQWMGAWDEYTRMCRGLITDDGGNVVARPFPKFFNLGEPNAPEAPNEPFEVAEKMDGSLIILALHEGRPVVASRGSFESEQANIARGIIRNRLPFPHALRPETTYLFELIHPSNRIVVDYGDESNLYLLAVIDNDSGQDLSIDKINALGFPRVPRYPEYADLSALPERENAEGYVIRFEGGTRLKVKHPEYVRIHRLISYATPKHVWEYLKDGKDPLEAAEGIPDEFYGEIKALVDSFRAEYAEIERSASESFTRMDGDLGADATRKDRAIWIQRNARDLAPVLFAMISGKHHEGIIWKQLRPKSEVSAGEGV